MRGGSAAAMLALLLPLARASAGEVSGQGEVRFDFETGDLQGWRVVEGQFDLLVSDRDVFHNRYPDQPGNRYNKQGRYYLSTVEQKPGLPSNDRMVGVVESPVFVLTGPEISMLVGSGTQPGTYVALCTLDGKEAVVARGKAETEVMQSVLWRVPELVGEKVFLRVVDRETGGWGHVTLDDFRARGRLEPIETRRRWTEVEDRRHRQRLEALAMGWNFPALRAAIRDLAESFPGQYDRAPELLARLDALERGLAVATPEEVDGLVGQVDALRREALTSNPLLRGGPIVYVVRHQYRSHYHAIDTLFHTGEPNADRGMTPHSDLFQGGGALKTLDVATGRVTTLLAVPEGVIRDPEVHFDGRRIVFSMRRHRDEDYHIWTIQADGTGLERLTSAPGVSDFDPLYLPDGHIAFSSTREPKYNQCSRDHGANLFRMEPDGANVHQIGKNNLFDNHGSLLPDGRILYARWEYVDRNFGDAHGVWTVNPDGTNPAIFWGNNTASPGAAYYPRIIPGTQQLLCIFGMHHFRLWGAMAIVDRARGIDGRPGVVRTWPAEAIDRVRGDGPFDCDGFVSVYPKYECPHPLSDTYFLCSRMTLRPGQPAAADAALGEEMGIYLLDAFGNELLVHCEPPGCYDPMPLVPRPRPPVLPARRDLEGGEGRFFVADVYRGTHMDGVPRGSVKRLRVVEAPEKRHWAPGAWFGQGYTAPAMNWHGLENKRILGTVPIEEDASAWFSVPAERFVYFQLLDEDGMMVQSMRSGTSLHSGETAGCIGCHEDRLSAPDAAPDAASDAAPGGPSRDAPLRGTMRRTTRRTTPLALRRPPSRLEGWYGSPRLFSYAAEVQPVLDRHCVACHDFDEPAGKKLNLAGDRSIAFNASYEELWRKGYIRCVGAGPAEIQPAYGWGARASRLVEELRRPRVPEHAGIRLTAEELDRIVTWVDLNGVYYPDYACAYPESLTGRCPLDGAQLGRLASLCGVPFDQTRSFSSSVGPQISFERPELSPCLDRFQDRNDPAYRESLEIIRSGGERLAARPRCDMPGFVPSEPDRLRETKYAERRWLELRIREAIRGGERVYDSGVTRFGETVSAPRVEGALVAAMTALGEGAAPSSIPDTIDAMAPRLMIAHHVPGVAVAGIDGRRVAWHREYGVRRAGSDDRVTPETVFEACSMTKPVFAYAVLKLVEEGNLSLDRPLVEYLEAPYLPDEPLHRTITARMVLSHTSGLPNWREGGWKAGGPLPVLFEPGSRFGYSGEGYLYLQRVVEGITVAPLQRYLREALLDPNGMSISSFAYEDRHEAIAAHGHGDRGEPREPRRLFREANAGYSLHCTAVEYARFLVEVMREDRAAAHSISERSVEAMLSAAVEATDRRPVARGGKRGSGPVRWSLGWAMDGTDGGDRIYHGGANGTGFRCYSEFDRRRGAGIVILTNAFGGRALWEKLLEAASPP